MAPVALHSVALFKEWQDRFALVALNKRATMRELLFRSFANKKTSDSLEKPKSEFPSLLKGPELAPELDHVQYSVPE